MAIGYFIHRGDRTSCGGVVLDGEPGMTAPSLVRACVRGRPRDLRDQCMSSRAAFPISEATASASPARWIASAAFPAAPT